MHPCSNRGLSRMSPILRGFVSMVPMGVAEIVKLQQEGFAYMH